ncbi:MAG: hypothetical protein Q8K98_08530 [Bacteroidota bacterium]|nr:hypothetical protein [Bacteroidota bacterium]
MNKQTAVQNINVNIDFQNRSSIQKVILMAMSPTNNISPSIF